MSRYAHLHTHSCYSALDGLAKIEELIIKAKELGQPAIAITDHGSSSGLYEAQELGKKYDFKVILGEEFYIEGINNKNGHIILLAKNDKGIENIFKLQHLAYNNFYYKPRINIDMLKEYNEGLICTNACIANPICQLILAGEINLAKNYLTDLIEIFGDDFYVEIQSSTVEDVIRANKKLIELAKDFNLKVIITNDIHYVNKEDYNVHEVLLAIQQQKKLDDKKRWRFENNDYWCKSEEEIEEFMPYLDREYFDFCYDNINEIIDKCNAEIRSGNYLPKWKDEEGLSEDESLEVLTYKNYIDRIKKRNECNEEFKNDLFKELKVIKEEGYSGYFMIVQEYANWARENGILVGDGRGSGAGCKVAYTIGITEVNPQKYDLLFERFLSHGREPDFDIDFSNIDAVFKHLQDKYGNNNVARVGAFNFFTCKSALRKVMSVHGFSQSQISRIVGLLPNRLTFTLKEAIEENNEFKEWLNDNKNIWLCVDKLEGTLSHLSTHAGGVIICNDLTSKLPIFTDSSDRTKLVVAFDKHIISELGHFKFDILGLNSLNLLDNALKNIDKDINWCDVDFEDKKVYEMISEGDVSGVFQLSEQADKVKEQQPKCFEDLIAINALIRPGVCDWNQYISYRNEEVKSNLEYMNCTHGLIVYQDQYLQLAQTYAGWDIAYSDKHIRKNKDILNDTQLHQKFINDGIANGYDKIKLEETWTSITSVVAGGYGFNRAHSTSYARLSYQTAWLKYYYPKEFYTAYLTQNYDDSNKIQEIQMILKEKNIKLLPPDINESNDKFSVVEDGIRFPLNSIKGVGGSVLYEINRLKPIKNLEDFKKRRVPKFIKKTSMYALIKSGAFDFCNISRNDMLESSGYEGEYKSNPEYEKESLGIYLTNSPLEKYLPINVDKLNSNDKVVGVVQLQNISIVNDKKGNQMAFLNLMAKNTMLRGIIFSSYWSQVKDTIEENVIYYIEGRMSNGSVIVNNIDKVD